MFTCLFIHLVFCYINTFKGSFIIDTYSEYYKKRISKGGGKNQFFLKKKKEPKRKKNKEKWNKNENTYQYN